MEAIVKTHAMVADMVSSCLGKQILRILIGCEIWLPKRTSTWNATS